MVDGRIDIERHGEISGPLIIIQNNPFNQIIRSDAEVGDLNVTCGGGCHFDFHHLDIEHISVRVQSHA